MKPLTIEELKALKVGDWVWIKDDEPFNDGGSYVKKCEPYRDDKLYCGTRGICYEFDYPSYGKTWFAYKNKEQAEAKGEIVELPCTIESDVFIIHENEIEVTQTVAINLYEDMGIIYLANNQEIKVWFKGGYYSNGVECFESGFEFSFDEKEAEAKLRKSKGDTQ